MDLIKPNSKEALLVVTSSENQFKYETSLAAVDKRTIATAQEITGLQPNSQNAILVDLPDEQVSDSVLTQLLHISQPGGQIIVTGIKSKDNLGFSLKIAGFVDVKPVESGALVASKPKYEIGSSAKLNLKPKAAVWKLDDDNDEETIDPDNLLDDDDLKKPDPASLRVCGTTGKRKACKDCSCGLADELATEAKSGNVVDTGNAPKSSCGNCYLGDAFRCASCPYLGMPAFKPGEKIQLSDNLLKADI